MTIENKTNDVWDEKFFRETPYMPFGSMMNAYGNINQGGEMEIKEFLADAKKIFKLSKSFVKSSYEFSKDVNKPDFLTTEQLEAIQEDKQGKYDATSQQVDAVSEIQEITETLQ